MAHEFAVSQKTIRRDLDALASVGFRVQESTGPHGRKAWRIDTDSILAGLTLTFEEVAAIYLGRRFLEPLAGTMFWEAAQSAFRKIRAGLGDETFRYLDQLATAFHQTALKTIDYSSRADAIDTLMIGIEDSRRVVLTYRSATADAAKQTSVNPYGFVWHHNALYLVGHSAEHAAVRHYKVDRIADVELQPDTFVRPVDFDLASHLAGTFGVFQSDGPTQTVRIRFQPEAAGYIREHHWHPSQRLTDHPDGTLTAEFDLADLHEVKAWVLSFGAKAMVEKPEGLRREIQDELVSISAAYDLGVGRPV
jgi:proteasome accessory factor B